MPSDVKAISPLLERVIRLIEESRCVPGEELALNWPFERLSTMLWFTATDSIPASLSKFIADVNWGKSCRW
jgi:hypothetical protein